MHGAGQSSNEHSGEAGRSCNNDWMTHHLSQQQPLAQWIQDRQKAFADFSQSLIAPPDTYQDYWPRPRQLEFSPVKASNRMLASNTAELSPKAKVSYDEGQFVVEIPLKDYRPEELSVKTEGEVLVILAKHETQTESGGSFVSKQFEQRFSLPSGVKPESIISSLGKDGTLKVTAPRTSSQPNLSFKKTRGALEEEVPNRAETTQNPANQGLPHPKVTYDDDKFLVSLDCKHFKPEELDVKVDGNTIVIVAKQEVKEAGGTRTRVFEQKFTLPNGVQAERVTSTINTDGVLTINAPKGKAASTASVSQSIEQKMDKILSPSSWPDHSLGSMDDFNDNSNSRAYVDGDMYNIDINVQQFKPEELVIKTVGQTVQVEAKHEEKTSDGASYSTRNFSQSFTLPRGVDPESVASSLSKDGKLTIKAPMPKANKISSNERLVPIKHN
jgi:HSP20 family molecular chaperone IbpA